jgi:hypothetical protein
MMKTATEDYRPGAVCGPALGCVLAVRSALVMDSGRKEVTTPAHTPRARSRAPNSAPIARGRPAVSPRPVVISKPHESSRS